MWEVLIKIVEKFACKHDWIIIVDEHEKSPLVNNVDVHKLLLKCKCCGKLKKVTMQVIVMSIDYKLYKGDCIELMSTLEDNSVDLILCDLPYNMTKLSWDCLIPFDKLWEQYKRIIKPSGNIVLFSAGLFTLNLIQSNIKDFRYKLIWKKNVPTGMASAKYRPMKYYEEICVFGNSQATYNPIMKERVGVGKACYNYDHYCGKNNHLDFGKQKRRYDPDWVQPSDVLEFNVVPNRNGKLHPTQKPVELLEYLIKTYSNENDIVLDNCMGSGSTGVACINTNRDFIGIEKDEKYYNIAEERIKNISVK